MKTSTFILDFYFFSNQNWFLPSELLVGSVLLDSEKDILEEEDEGEDKVSVKGYEKSFSPPVAILFDMSKSDYLWGIPVWNPRNHGDTNNIKIRTLVNRFVTIRALMCW